MADQEQPADTQVVPPEQPSQADIEEPSQELDAKALKAQLAEVRREAARYRTENKRLSDAQAARETAELTAQQKLERERDQLKAERDQLLAQRQERIARDAITEAARAAGAIYPEDLYDLVRSDIELNDEGKVKNATAVIRAYKERRPALFGGGPPPPGNGHMPRPLGGAKDIADQLIANRYGNKQAATN